MDLFQRADSLIHNYKSVVELESAISEIHRLSRAIDALDDRGHLVA